MIVDSDEFSRRSNPKFQVDRGIHKSVLRLKEMITTILEEYLKISDSNILESAVEINAHWLMCPKCNDVWESHALNAMIICPNCACAFHDPRVAG